MLQGCGVFRVEWMGNEEKVAGRLTVGDLISRVGADSPIKDA